MRTPVLGLYLGTVRPMPGDGRPTAIFKRPATGRRRLAREGFVDDVQADRRVHGGPDKAVHLFPQDNYAVLAERAPEAVAAFVPGSIGENLSIAGWTEADVCIGDVYRFGSARLQLCQPRRPCWKIDARYGVEGLTRHLFETGRAGWYFRVLEEGEAGVGDTLELEARVAQPVSVARFWELQHAARPDPDELERLAAEPGLAEAWRPRLRERIDWLRRQGPASA